MISMFCFLLIILSYQGIFTFVDSEKEFRTFTFLSRVFLTCVALYKWKLWICKWRFDLSTMVLFHQWYNALSTMVQLYQYEKFLLSEGGGGVLSSSSIQLFNLESLNETTETSYNESETTSALETMYEPQSNLEDKDNPNISKDDFPSRTDPFISTSNRMVSSAINDKFGEW